MRGIDKLEYTEPHTDISDLFSLSFLSSLLFSLFSSLSLSPFRFIFAALNVLIDALLGNGPNGSSGGGRYVTKLMNDLEAHSPVSALCWLYDTAGGGTAGSAATTLAYVHYTTLD